MSYEGYKNWETYAVTVYLMNDEYAWSALDARAKKWARISSSRRPIESAIIRLARAIVLETPREFIFGEGGNLSRVRWREVASAFMPEEEEE